MKNYGDLGRCYPPRPTASTDKGLAAKHVMSRTLLKHVFLPRVHADATDGTLGLPFVSFVRFDFDCM